MAETKKIAGAAGIGAALIAGAVALLPDYAEIEGSYSIVQANPYCAEVHITVPDEFTPDIVTLKMNNMEISKALLPDGYISTYPVIVSDTDRLTLDMYVRGEIAGYASFDGGGTLNISVNKNYLTDVEEETPAPTAEPKKTPAPTAEVWETSAPIAAADELMPETGGEQ